MALPISYVRTWISIIDDLGWKGLNIERTFLIEKSSHVSLLRQWLTMNSSQVVSTNCFTYHINVMVDINLDSLSGNCPQNIGRHPLCQVNIAFFQTLVKLWLYEFTTFTFSTVLFQGARCIIRY